ncbi:HNH endonuclease signature motif containing protein [Nocardioides salarius]|uniref:HNH endonuclease signature motif containing protein n=1 Tax=Nocardioides salarius TaxID=374513 RepID=UPI0030F7793D
MSQAATAQTLVEVSRAEARLVEVRSQLLSHAETVAVAETNASPSVAVWHSNATGSTKRESFRQVRLAAGLDRYELVREALGRGDVIAEQASVICTALDELPDDLDAAVLEQATKALVTFAEVHDAKALRVLGRRILEVVAPEVAEAWEAEQLEKEEREAEKSAVFRMREDGHGRIKGSFTVPLLAGQMLERALLAFAAPKHQIATREAEEEQSEAPVPVRRPTAQRLGAAFVELVERLDPHDLPKAGGVNATVVVTMTLDSLKDGLVAATLDTGDRISAATARRLACEAGVVPVVLGGKSQPLDVGRAKRYFTSGQRIAMGIRDGGCTAKGCDAPPAMCHAHHDDPWSCHGHTDLDRGRLLCPFHHRRIHDPEYEVDVGADNQVTFHRRT